MCNKCNTTDRKSFFITTDGDGKMPRLERTRTPSRPYYVQYVNDKPVVVSPYFSQTKVWDYSQSMFLGLHPNAKRHNYDPMPVYQGRVV